MACDVQVSVYADVQGKCRKGWTARFEDQKLFVGNGITKMSRQELFSSKIPPR